jgi:hypothetical protein
MTPRDVIRIIERNGAVLLRQRAIERDLEPVFGPGWLRKK